MIFISHKLHEVKAVADRVTVLRGGRTVATVDAAGATPRSLAALMVGRQVELRPRVEREAPHGDDVALEVEGSAASRRSRQRRGRGRLADRAARRDRRRRRRGGQRPARARRGDLRHARRRAPGPIRVGGTPAAIGRPARGDRGRRRARPRGPARHGPRAEPSASPRTPCSSPTGGRPSRAARSCSGAACTSTRAIAHPPLRREDAGPDTPARNLSGGNLQKLVLGREFEGEPKVLIAAQPTRGLDVGAIETVHAYLRAGGAERRRRAPDQRGPRRDPCARRPHRRHVRGRVAGEVDPEAATVEEIGLLMAGGERAREASSAARAAAAGCPSRSRSARSRVAFAVMAVVLAATGHDPGHDVPAHLRRRRSSATAR